MKNDLLRYLATFAFLLIGEVVSADSVCPPCCDPSCQKGYSCIEPITTVHGQVPICCEQGVVACEHRCCQKGQVCKLIVIVDRNIRFETYNCSNP